ncbi:MAG TPA: fucose isomerase, partial [Planctomycetota bacterium]|nr:fucose isomerase [Planctomycetota bacterium]
MIEQKPVKIGFIPANRGFFSDALAARMRGQTLDALDAVGVETVVPSESDTKVGTVETLDDAIKVGRMFREKAVDGVLVSAVNFGDEQGVAITLKESGLKVPVLIVGCQEEETLTMETERRDSFCGLLSIGEALRQMGLSYSVPEVPLCFPTDASFRGTLERFVAVCRVVNGIRGARYGQVGARPDAFWTCRYNEKALQELGVTVVTLDLSEVFAAVAAMRTSPSVKEKIAEIKENLDTTGVDDAFLVK